MSLYSIILAAGEGKRMKSKLPKPLQKVCGKTLIDRVISAVTEAGAEKNIAVIGHMSDKMEEYLGDRVEYAYQRERLGTGHAVMQGIVSVSDKDGSVIVVCGDTPLITAEMIKEAYGEHTKECRAATVITAVCDNPFGYGRIVRRDGRVVKIVEQKDATGKRHGLPRW